MGTDRVNNHWVKYSSYWKNLPERIDIILFQKELRPMPRHICIIKEEEWVHRYKIEKIIQLHKTQRHT